MGTVQGSKVRLEQLRPRAKSKLSFLKLDLKHEVLVNNHNIEKLEERLLVLRHGDGLEKYLAGGYKDDEDNGDTFLYTEAGFRLFLIKPGIISYIQNTKINLGSTLYFC